MLLAPGANEPALNVIDPPTVSVLDAIVLFVPVPWIVTLP